MTAFITDISTWSDSLQDIGKTLSRLKLNPSVHHYTAGEISDRET